MDEFKVISVMNEANIEMLKDKKQNYEQYILIREKLQDEGYFFKIDKVQAYDIIKLVGVKHDKVEETYKKLTSPQKFYELINRGIIKENDKNLIVKYNTFHSEDLFKKEKGKK